MIFTHQFNPFQFFKFIFILKVIFYIKTCVDIKFYVTLFWNLKFRDNFILKSVLNN